MPKIYTWEKEYNMTQAQEECYNAIQQNDRILIVKKRQSGTTSLLAAYVVNELNQDYNKTICFMSPSSSMNAEFMSIVYSNLVSIRSAKQVMINNNKQIKTINGNKIISKINRAESFCGEQKIDIFIYDEIGFERGDFPALYKTLCLYRPFKTIFTFTTEDHNKVLAPYLESVQDWLLTTDCKRIKLPMFTGIREQTAKNDMYDRIRELYNS